MVLVLLVHRGAMNMDIKPVLADFVYFLQFLGTKTYMSVIPDAIALL